MKGAELIKPIVEFLLKKRKDPNGPNNFSGEITFFYAEIQNAIPRLGRLGKFTEILNSLTTKDCWFNECKQAAIHNLTIIKGTYEGNAKIIVNCSTGFLLAKLKDLNKQIEGRAEINKQTILISDTGIRLKNRGKEVYSIGGKRKKLVLYLLKYGEPLPALEIMGKLKYSMPVLSDEVNTINKIFSKTFKKYVSTDHLLIINKPQGSGYRLNLDNFIIDMEPSSAVS
jgi:hypothetical protein